MGDRPNILLVTADHWPGHTCIQTPTLDELARSGRRYCRAYSEAPLCVPARRAVMTGRAPRRANESRGRAYARRGL